MTYACGAVLDPVCDPWTGEMYPNPCEAEAAGVFDWQRSCDGGFDVDVWGPGTIDWGWSGAPGLVRRQRRRRRHGGGRPGRPGGKQATLTPGTLTPGTPIGGPKTGSGRGLQLSAGPASAPRSAGPLAPLFEGSDLTPSAALAPAPMRLSATRGAAPMAPGSKPMSFSGLRRSAGTLRGPLSAGARYASASRSLRPASLVSRGGRVAARGMRGLGQNTTTTLALGGAGIGTFAALWLAAIYLFGRNR